MPKIAKDKKQIIDVKNPKTKKTSSSKTKQSKNKTTKTTSSTLKKKTDNSRVVEDADPYKYEKKYIKYIRI